LNDERDPTGRQVHDLGAKLDDGKIMASLLKDFSFALTEALRCVRMVQDDTERRKERQQ